jgi:repressor LexA
MSSDLRYQERELLEWLVQALGNRDDYLSLTEIKENLDGSTLGRVQISLKKLEREGYIRSHPDTPPGFTILRYPDGTSVPVKRPTYSQGETADDRNLETESPPNSADLSPRQREVYELILKGRAKAHPPSIPQIMRSTGLSKSRVHQHLQTLERKGFIVLPRELLPRESDGPDVYKPRESRRIVVVGWQLLNPPAASTVSVRVIGHIAAGRPILVRGHEEWTSIPTEMLGANESEQIYVLIVEGESMVGAAVLPGDRIVVRKQQIASDGDMVIAQLQNSTTGEWEATLKRYRHEAGHARLVAASDGGCPGRRGTSVAARWVIRRRHPPCLV